MNKKYYAAVIGLAAVASLAAALPASAQTIGVNPGGPMQPSYSGSWEGHGSTGMTGHFGGQAMRPGVFGTVSAINGDILTITQKGFGSTTPATAKTFTVDATNATVLKNNATSTLSSIAVGDMIAAQGTLTGTNLVATTIRDGFLMRGTPETPHPMGKMATSTPAFTGNGEPVTAGSVTAINGTSLTITNKSNVTYSIDASSAQVLVGNKTSSLSSVSIGDSIVVQGTVNGTSVTASTIIDQAKPANANASSTPKRGMIGGFFGGIGSFFSHLFGF